MSVEFFDNDDLYRSPRGEIGMDNLTEDTKAATEAGIRAKDNGWDYTRVNGYSVSQSDDHRHEPTSSATNKSAWVPIYLARHYQKNPEALSGLSNEQKAAVVQAYTGIEAVQKVTFHIWSSEPHVFAKAYRLKALLPDSLAAGIFGVPDSIGLSEQRKALAQTRKEAIESGRITKLDQILLKLGIGVMERIASRTILSTIHGIEAMSRKQRQDMIARLENIPDVALRQNGIALVSEAGQKEKPLSDAATLNIRHKLGPVFGIVDWSTRLTASTATKYAEKLKI